MTPWLIIRTDHAKEGYVARHIGLMGFPAWVPSEQRFSRIHRLSKARKLIDYPLLPKRLLAAVPVAVQGDLREIRHLVAVECDAASLPLQIPAIQVERFRQTVDAMNTSALALQAAKSRKAKAQWRNLKDALHDMIEQAKQQREKAA